MLQNLSEIVIEEGLATAGQVRSAARLADKDKVPLVEALVRTAGVDELELVKAIGRHSRAQVADPGTLEVDLDAARQVAQDVCLRRKVVPLDLSAPGPKQTLRLAMADPTDAVAIAEIEHRCGCRVVPVVAPLSTVEALIKSSYRELVTEVMAREPEPVIETAAGETRESDRGPTTQPHVRMSEATSVAVRLEAVIRLLHAKGIASPEELDAMVAELVKGAPGKPGLQ